MGRKTVYEVYVQYTDVFGDVHECVFTARNQDSWIALIAETNDSFRRQKKDGIVEDYTVNAIQR